TGAMTLGALLPATPGHTQVARQVVRVLQNGPNDAVPVTLQGGGANAGNVNVINTPNVHVTSLPAVQVDSSVAGPLFTRNVNDAVEPVQISKSIFQMGSPVPIVTVFTVPADRRLVVEFVSAVMAIPPPQQAVELNIETTVQGTASRHYFPFQNQGTEK